MSTSDDDTSRRSEKSHFARFQSFLLFVIVMWAVLWLAISSPSASGSAVSRETFRSCRRFQLIMWSTSSSLFSDKNVLQSHNILTIILLVPIVFQLFLLTRSIQSRHLCCCFSPASIERRKNRKVFTAFHSRLLPHTPSHWLLYSTVA